MTREEAYDAVIRAVEATKPGASSKVSETTDLIEDGILDSLDSMNLLFELETQRGAKLVAIDETFSDFRVTRLVDILVDA